MSSGTQKPPLAPKPNIVQTQRPGLPSSASKRDGLSQLSPATPKRVKPALAPKPCLPTAVESKPLSSKTLHQTSVQENGHSRSIGLLNSKNGIQQENKKPDWDYIIPICLCSQENCLCMGNSNAADKVIDKIEKDLKTLHKCRTEESRKPRFHPKPDNRGDKTDNIKCQVVNNTRPLPDVCVQAVSPNNHLSKHKPPEDTAVRNKLTETMNQNLDPDIVMTRPDFKCALPQRTQSDEANGHILTSSKANGRGAEEEPVCSTESRHHPTSVPAVPRKPFPVPVPRKPRKAGLTRQEALEEEREEREGRKGMEMTVKEVKVSLERKNSPSLSVSTPVHSQNAPVSKSDEHSSSSRKTCPAPPPTPAPPPKYKAFLSGPKRVLATPPQHLPQDVEEEELGWDESIYKMECSVDEEEVEGREEEEGAYSDLACCPLPTSLPNQLVLNSHSPLTVNSEEDGAPKVAPPKPQRHSYPAALVVLKRELSEAAGEGMAKDGEVGHGLSMAVQDGAALKERTMRELPVPPEEKTGRRIFQTLYSNKSRKTSTDHTASKPSRSSLLKKKAKSFSSADLIRSEGQKRGSFRKLLAVKLSVKKLPKLLAKGGQSLDCRVEETEQCVDGDLDDVCFQERLGARRCEERKFSCPQLPNVEQSVDGDEFYPGVVPAVDYENMPVYEEIPEYMNLPAVGSAVSPQLAQPASHNSMYDDDNIYEEQEPFMPLEKHTEHHLQHSGTERSSIDEEVAQLGDGHLDEDMVHSSEEEDDDSSTSSKGDSEPQGEIESGSGPKKSKVVHIAREIMSSENAFVDVLKLLHIDFRDAVAKASGQSGKPVVEERVLNQILYYLPQLYELNQDLLRELEERVAQWDEHGRLADIFVKKGPYLKMYSTYIREFDKNVALLDEQSKKNPVFAGVVREFEASPRCASLALRHYLLKPVQRIPQYQLLLTDYLRNLPPESADYKDTQAALGIVKEVASHANDIMKQGDNFQKLIQVQCSLNGQREIVQPGRVFLKEGILMKLSRKVMQPRMFFLFNDTLLYTTPVQSGQYKLNNMLSLAGMKVSKPSQEANQNELNIESVERSFILSASCASERDEWLEAISTAISDYTRKKISFISSKTREETEPWDNESGAPLGSKAPIWIPDPRATMCMICTCEFTLTWRRHHCRACGKVVCQSCSSNKHCLEYLKNQLARVCDQCILVLQQERNEQTTTLSPGVKSSFAFPRKTKRIPAALKEVTANTVNSSMSGYLQRSKGNKKQGKRLWFVIKNKVLYTYAASENVAALESQPLLGFMLKEESSQKLQFKLYHKNTFYYIFKADDIQTAQRWIDAFNEAMVL